jgi:CrcB protein
MPLPKLPTAWPAAPPAALAPDPVAMNGPAAGWVQVAAVATGAALGACLRWQAGARLGLVAGIPAGTVLVNLGGGALIGLAVAWLSAHPGQDLWRLFCVVGFLGGLTTFSAFSAESLALLQAQRFGAALAHTLVHVLGALLLAAAGYAAGRHWFA